MRVLVSALILCLAIGQVKSQDCAGKSCSDCLAISTCGFCKTSANFECVRLVVASVGAAASCPASVGTSGGTADRITDVTRCPTTTDPCATNPCVTGSATKCVRADGQTPPYVCVDPCVGVQCDTNQRCSSATGAAVCIAACGTGVACVSSYCVCSTATECACFPTPCGNRCTLLTSSVCDVSSATCKCPEGTVVVAASAASAAACVVPPRINPCQNFTCPYLGQVCVVAQSADASAAHCVCPDGTSLALSEASTVNGDGVQTAAMVCRANPCNSVVCPLNRHCVNSVTAATGAFVTVCVCNVGYTSEADGITCDPISACQSPQVADQTTGACVSPCWDGSAPANNVCPPVVCPDGTVVNPVSLVGCGVICADGSWAPSILRCPCIFPWIIPKFAHIAYRFCCNSTRYEIPDAASTFPGTTASPINQLCVRCPCATSNLVTCVGYPVEGRCPGVVCPAGWVLAENPTRCRFVCPDSSHVDYAEQCPPPVCVSPQVNDQLTRVCVAPCPDGSSPYNGFCPVVCPAGSSTYDCCVIKGGANCVPPCPTNTVPLSNLDATCVPICANGYPRDPITGKCREDDNGCPVGATRFNTSSPCLYPCPARTTLSNLERYRVSDINLCCIRPASFDTLDLICRCPDGRRAKDDGSCDHNCDPNTDIGCPCPTPLTRDATSKLCVCPSGTSLTAGGCQINPIECPRGLVPSAVSRACVCPDGNEPVQDRCPCNPAADASCPVTIFNCNWAGVATTFALCKCLISSTAGAVDPMCLPSAQTGADVTVTVDWCRANSAQPVCFCVLHPDGHDCKRRHPCNDAVYASTHTCECDPSSCSKPCIAGDPTSYCPIEKYCAVAANAVKPRCICFLFPKNCSYVNPPVVPSTCSDAAQNDPTNKNCYCHFHTDASCFNADGEGQADTGGGTGATITADNSCADSSDPTCHKETPDSSETPTDTTVHMPDTRNGGGVRDVVNATISTLAGRCGDIIFVREATALIPGADVNDVSTYFRLMLSSVVEFGDANDNGKLDDGDDIRTKLDVSTLTCVIKTSSTSLSGARCYTVTVYDTTGVLTFTFTICSSALTIGTRAVPARSAFEILEIQWSYSAADSKLALFFDAFALDLNDVFVWVSSSSTLELQTSTGVNKGSLTFDLHARSGDNSNIPLNFQLQQATTVSAISALPSENTAYRLIVSVDAFAPFPLIVDPVYTAGNQQATQSMTSAASTNTLSFIAFMLSLAAFVF